MTSWRHTDPVERSTGNHEAVSFSSVQRLPILVRQLIGTDEHAEPADTDEYPLS